MTAFGEGARSLDERVLELVGAAHRAEPWSLGSTSLALARRLDLAESVLFGELSRMVEAGALERRFGYFALPGYVVTLSDQQREFFAPLLPAENDETALPVAFAAVSAAVRATHVDGVAKAFDTLLATGALVRIGDDLFRASQLASMRRSIDAHFREHDRLTVAQFRDRIGTTRKRAVPLLEWFDRRGVTRREGLDRTRGDAVV